MKIFGIGLSKTGTTSLASALGILGYRVKDNPGTEHYIRGDLSSIDRRILDDHDAITDTPIPSFYRELDVAYPGSKFILTIRDIDAWLASCRKQFNPNATAKQSAAHRQIFADLYQTPGFDAQKFREGYQRFVAEAQAYFRQRPQDLLVLDVSGGEGWEKLCPFLNKAIPQTPFPKANVTAITWMDVSGIAAIARDAGRELLLQRAIMFPDLDQRAPTDLTLKQRVRILASRLRRLFGGSEQDALDAVTKNIDALVSNRLIALNREIPVLCRSHAPPPHVERCQWNHCWLVNSLDGEGSFRRRDSEFSINIALIQDGKPLIGVVYAPAMGLLYCARGSTPGFKENAHEGRRTLAPHATLAENLDGNFTNAEDRPPLLDGASVALKICELVESNALGPIRFDRTTEWNTAAAQAIAVSVGRKILDPQNNVELRYNKQDLENQACTLAPPRS